jgi:hypothetical protein
VATRGKKILKAVGLSEDGSRPLGRRGYTWKGDTEIDVKETRLVGVEWIRSVQD